MNIPKGLPQKVETCFIISKNSNGSLQFSINSIGTVSQEDFFPKLYNFILSKFKEKSNDFNNYYRMVVAKAQDKINKLSES